MRAEAIRYLTDVGFDFKSAESPDLWTHLESHFYGRQPIGARFDPLPSDAIADLIMQGEEALLDALMHQHQRTGTLSPVSHVLNMPYVVGCDRSIHKMKSSDTLALIDQPGMATERLVHVVRTDREKIPSTHQATVKGGVYADGHTVGFFDLIPGDHSRESSVETDHPIYLATSDEIAALVKEMEVNIEDIVLATEAECKAMIARALRAISH
jgi:hypothetical protein